MQRQQRMGGACRTAGRAGGLAALLLAVCAASTAVLAQPAPSAHTLPTDAEIRRQLAVRVDGQRRSTGVVVAITTPAGHRVIAYGVRGLNDRAPVDARTVYDIGSLTKVFTSLLLTEAVQRGEVRLDEPVQACLPPGSPAMPSRNGRQITFADLATHTSGLPLRPANRVSKDPDDKYAGYTAPLLMQFLGGYQLPRAPGASYEYSNVGFGLLGLTLEHCAHGDYATLVRTRITEPLRLRDTALTSTPDMRRRQAASYDGDLKRALPHWNMGVLDPAGGLKSTADDLLAFLDAALGFKASPLTPAMQKLTATERPGGMQPATVIALGWNILRDGGREVVWKNGSVAGYRTFMGYDAKAGVGVVALANAQTSEGADDIGLHLLDPAFPVNLSIPRPHHEVRLSPEVLDRYVGVYRFSDTDIFTVRRVGDQLIGYEPGSDPLPLFAEGEGRFFLKVQDVDLTFSGMAAGHPARLIWLQGGTEQVGARTADPR